MPVEFETLRFRGKRFDPLGTPVETLVDLVAYRTLILEVGKGIARSLRASGRAPKGFEASLVLRLVSITEGSSTLTVARDIDPDLSSILGPELFPTDDPFTVARQVVEETLAAVQTDPLRPLGLTRPLARLFAEFGKSLQAGESIELRPPDHTEPIARVTPESRAKFVEFAEVLPEAVPTIVVGVVFEVDSGHRTFTVQTRQRQVSGSYPIFQAREIRRVLADEETGHPVVALLAQAVRRPDGTADYVVSIDGIVPAGDEAREVITAKLELLRTLGDGWDGPGSRSISFVALENFEHLLTALKERATIDLEPIALQSGGIRLEWTRWSTDYVVEFEADGGLYLCQLGNDESQDRDLELAVFDLGLLEGFIEEGRFE